MVATHGTAHLRFSDVGFVLTRGTFRQYVDVELRRRERGNDASMSSGFQDPSTMAVGVDFLRALPAGMGGTQATAPVDVDKSQFLSLEFQPRRDTWLRATRVEAHDHTSPNQHDQADND